MTVSQLANNVEEAMDEAAAVQAAVKVDQDIGIDLGGTPSAPTTGNYRKRGATGIYLAFSSRRKHPWGTSFHYVLRGAIIYKGVRHNIFVSQKTLVRRLIVTVREI